MTRLPLILALLLVGCAGPLPMTHEADKMQACFSVRWETPERIAAICDLGVTRRLPSAACEFVASNVIVTRKPRDWYDTEAFISLGHEIAHVLGMEHPND